MHFCGVEKRLFFRYSSAALLVLLLTTLLLPSRHTSTSIQVKGAAGGASGPKSLPPPHDAFQWSSNASNLRLTEPAVVSSSVENPTRVTGTTSVSHKDSPLDSAAAQETNIPSSQRHSPQLHLVVAHYSEEPFYMRRWIDSVRSIPYMQDLGIKVIIYTKNPETDLAALQETTAADEVIQLPNIGREGSTYLHHLLKVYDDPPQFIMFTQAIIKKGQYLTGEVSSDHVAQLKDWLYSRLATKFNSAIGFMSLDRKHDICYCGHCTDMGRNDFYPLWPQLYTLLEGAVCQELEGHVLSFNGHFIVSRRRILARPRPTYEYLKDLVDAPAAHWIHAEPEPKWFERDKGKSVPSNPKFGHTLERLWHIIFQCSDPAQLVDCDVSGMQAEGPGGCTCID